MNFDDTPQEAAFRAEARAWIQANAPAHLHPQLALAGYGQPALQDGDVLAASKAWQLKKQQVAGPACTGRWPMAGAAPARSSA